jgi:dTMP kinase
VFITFEGIEGMGKTTHVKWMAEQLKLAQIPVLITREPGGTPIGEEIRDILLKLRDERVVPKTELLLMFAARAQHIETVIRPALAQKHWVLCDRFIDATYAYQGGGRGIAMEVIAKLDRLILEGFQADYTFIFDAPVEVGLKRVKRRGNQDRFEQEEIDFFERVRQVYQARARADLKRCKIIDATRSLEEVHKEVSNIASDLIKSSHVY